MEDAPRYYYYYYIRIIQDRYWPFVTIKKRNENFFFFDTHSLFALRTAGHCENDNVEAVFIYIDAYCLPAKENCTSPLPGVGLLV